MTAAAQAACTSISWDQGPVTGASGTARDAAALHAAGLILEDAVPATSGVGAAPGAAARRSGRPRRRSGTHHMLADTQARSVIEPECLEIVEVLGEGAYAVVEKAW